MSEHSPYTPVPQLAPPVSTLGLLDRVDVFCGQFADGTDPSGQRRRSFGATVFFWLSLPGVVLVFATAIAMVLVAWSTTASYPRSSIDAYKICIKKAKVLSVVQACKIPEPKAQKSLAKGILELGWPPWCFVGLLVLIGFASWLLRDQLHLKAFVESAQALSVYVTAGRSPPASILDAVSAAAMRLGGGGAINPTPGSPDAVAKAKAAAPEDPGPPPQEKTTL